MSPGVASTPSGRWRRRSARPSPSRSAATEPGARTRSCGRTPASRRSMRSVPGSKSGRRSRFAWPAAAKTKASAPSPPISRSRPGPPTSRSSPATGGEPVGAAMAEQAVVAAPGEDAVGEGGAAHPLAGAAADDRRRLGIGGVAEPDVEDGASLVGAGSRRGLDADPDRLHRDALPAAAAGEDGVVARRALPGAERGADAGLAGGADLVAGTAVAGAETRRRLPHHRRVAVVGEVEGVAPAVQGGAAREVEVRAPDVLAGVEHVAAGGGGQGLRERQRVEPPLGPVGGDPVVEAQLLERQRVVLRAPVDVDRHRLRASPARPGPAAGGRRRRS